MMQRTQVLLERWQYDTLKGLAERSGRSLSETLRQILTSHLQLPKNARERLLPIEGLGSDAKASGRDHDRLLYGARPGR